jgi:hypothetical protein
MNTTAIGLPGLPLYIGVMSYLNFKDRTPDFSQCKLATKSHGVNHASS